MKLYVPLKMLFERKVLGAIVGVHCGCRVSRQTLANNKPIRVMCEAASCTCTQPENKSHPTITYFTLAHLTHKATASALDSLFLSGEHLFFSMSFVSENHRSAIAVE